MKAAVFEEFAQPLAIQNVPDPIAPEDGVVIRVMANGICRSDWHGWMGHDPDVSLPHVPGHELAGIIEAVGSDVHRWQPGDRVTVPFACGCGDCAQCLTSNPVSRPGGPLLNMSPFAMRMLTWLDCLRVWVLWKPPAWGADLSPRFEPSSLRAEPYPGNGLWYTAAGA